MAHYIPVILFRLFHVTHIPVTLFRLLYSLCPSNFTSPSVCDSLCPMNLLKSDRDRWGLNIHICDEGVKSYHGAAY
jgi:hypothetical protein